MTVAALPYTPAGAGEMVAAGPDTDMRAAAVAVAAAVGYVAACFAHVEACSAHAVVCCTSQVAAYTSSHSSAAKAEGLAAYAVVLDSNLRDEEHFLTPAEILAAVAEACAVAVYFENALRSVREVKPRELVACAGTPAGIGNAVASWALLVGGLRP